MNAHEGGRYLNAETRAEFEIERARLRGYVGRYRTIRVCPAEMLAAYSVILRLAGECDDAETALAEAHAARDAARDEARRLREALSAAERRQLRRARP